MQAGRGPGRSEEGWRVGGREQGEVGEAERDRGEGQEAMMLGRERASVEEWRSGGLREGGLMKGRNEAWAARGKDGSERRRD